MSKRNTNSVNIGIVGAAIVPHAPQLLNMPDTEDLDQAARVKAKMQQIGDAIRALEPDLIVIISNCHGEELAVDCVPAFMIHCGDRADGAGKHDGVWRIDGDAGQELAALMLEEGFDPAFTFSTDVGTAFTIAHEYCGFSRDIPFLPIFVNVYVPPQPSPQRCFAFGKALTRCFERMRRRVAVIVSGGLSHYPATPMYPTPDLATDQIIFDRLSAGNLLYLMSFDAKALDKTGNVESRSLQIMAGCIGDRKPDHALFEPSWHHIYAVIGWTSALATENYEPLYPGFAAQHSELARAINKIVHDDIALADYRQNRATFATRFDLTPDQGAALVKLDEDDLRVNFAINPMLTYTAKLRVGDPLKHRLRLDQRKQFEGDRTTIWARIELACAARVPLRLTAFAGIATFMTSSTHCGRLRASLRRPAPNHPILPTTAQSGEMVERFNGPLYDWSRHGCLIRQEAYTRPVTLALAAPHRPVGWDRTSLDCATQCMVRSRVLV